jgi:metal-responsive CopG/Arc/MetJ family transcriptional regulator
MREPIFPDYIQLKAPEGMLAAVKDAAREEGQTASEFIRVAIRAQLRRVEPEHVAAGD